MKFLDELAESNQLKGKLVNRLHPAPEMNLKSREEAKESVRDWVVGSIILVVRVR